MKIYKLFVSIICVILFAGVAYGKTYKIIAAEWIGYSPAHVADAKGFWKDQGIDVNVFTVTNPQEITYLFKQGLADVAFEMIGSIVHLHMEGIPIKIIAETDWSNGGDKIVVKANTAGNSLKGKTIGTYFDAPSVTFFLNRYLTSVGLKLTDTRIIEMEPDQLASQFIKGTFEAIVCFDPFARQAEREGNGKVVATTATYEGCMPEGMMVMQKTLESIPAQDDVKKILKGWIQAVLWSQDEKNWKEYVDILNRHTFKHSGPLTESDLKEMVNAVKIHDVDALKARNMNDGGLHSYLKDVKTFLSTNNLLKKDFNEDLFHNQLIVDVLNEIEPVPNQTSH